MINNLGTNPVNIQQLAGANPVTAPGSDGDGDHGIEPNAGAASGTSLNSAVAQAISQLNSNGSATSATAQSAVQSFMQQLLSAIYQADNGGSAGTPGGSTTNGASAASSSAQYASNGGMRNNLSALIQQVSNSPSSNTALQESFQSMLTAIGANPGSHNLGSFLQSLSSDMQGSLLVNTMG